MSRARERKRSQSERDPDATTLLPRAAGGRRLPPPDDDVEDDDLEADPKADRRRLLLLIGAVAVVAILGLVGGYAIIKTTGQPTAAPGPSTSAGPTDPGATPSGETSDPGTALITDDLMLSAAQAETIDKKRTWKVALTQRGTTEDSPHHPACLADRRHRGGPAASADGAPAARAATDPTHRRRCTRRRRTPARRRPRRRTPSRLGLWGTAR